MAGRIWLADVLRDRGCNRCPFGQMNADPEVMEHFPEPLTRGDSDLLVDRIEVQHAEHDGLAPVGGFAQQLTDEVLPVPRSW